MRKSPGGPIHGDPAISPEVQDSHTPGHCGSLAPGATTHAHILLLGAGFKFDVREEKPSLTRRGCEDWAIRPRTRPPGFGGGAGSRRPPRAEAQLKVPGRPSQRDPRRFGTAFSLAQGYALATPGRSRGPFEGGSSRTWDSGAV